MIILLNICPTGNSTRQPGDGSAAMHRAGRNAFLVRPAAPVKMDEIRFAPSDFI
jgi:hypothetical protein